MVAPAATAAASAVAASAAAVACALKPWWQWPWPSCARCGLSEALTSAAAGGADTEFGGQIAWGISEIPTLIVLVALSWQWSRSDDKEARRLDRKADRDGDADLVAYNAQLARLAKRDARDADQRAKRTNPKISKD